MQLNGLEVLKSFINHIFQGKEPYQIVTTSVSTVIISLWLWEFLIQDESE